MSRMISRGKGHDPFRFPFARCPQRVGGVAPPAPPAFGTGVIYNEEETRIVTDANVFLTQIAAPVPPGYFPGKYYVGFRVDVQTEGIQGSGQIEVQFAYVTNPPLVRVPLLQIVACTSMMAEDHDPYLNLNWFDIVDFTAVANLNALEINIRKFDGLANVNVVAAGFSAIEMWFWGL